MLRNFLVQQVQALFERLRLFKSIFMAVLHIAREQLKVVVASSNLLLRYGRLMFRKAIARVISRKLTLVIYGLFAALTLKFFILTASLFTILQPPLIAVQLLDGALIFLVVALVYFLGAIVHPLIRMERHENKDVLEFGDDFGQLLALRGAIESMPEAFSFWDKNRRLVLANEKFKEVYHLKDDSELTNNYYRFEAVVNRLMMRSPRARKGFSAAQYEAQMRDGKWLHIHETPTVDGGLVSVSFDVTKLKSSQQNLAIREQQMRSTVENLRASRRELERKTQKLAELADKYMREKERAEEGNRVKSEFLANISHELRTPLNAIIGFSDMMHREVLGPMNNEHYAGYINDIYMSGSYLLELINDILDMSRIEAGRLILEKKECSLKPIIDDCFQLVQPQAQEHNILLEQKISDEIQLIIDRRAIKQVLLNLLSNAIKFTPAEGKVSLNVLTEGESVFLKVTDTGIGIEEAALKNLGKPFQQVENQLTKCHSGTGLGLAISRSLVDLHGGRLTIESVVGEGTEVLVCLPIHGKQTSPDRNQNTEQIETRSEKVLAA